MFAVGDDVFVAVTSFRGDTFLHIRRYQKYGTTYYPTREGVAMTPWQFHRLFSRSVPATQHDLDIALQLLFDNFKVESVDFNHFIFTRNSISKNGITVSKSINLMLNQWEKIQDHLDDILNVALDFKFREMHFKDVFESLADDVLDENLPSSLDVSNGTECVSRILYNVVCDLIKDHGGLINPVRFDNDIICETNSVMDFNNTALYLDVNDIAIHFREELWQTQTFLNLPPSRYVTIEFLKSVSLEKLIKKARQELCPPCDE